MSRRGRLRRRGNSPVGSTTGGTAVKANPIAADMPRADAPPRREAGGDAAALMAVLEVEVPIDLSTELQLAAAAAKPRTDEPLTVPASRPADLAPATTGDQLKRDVQRRLVDRLELAALETITDVAQLAARVREAATNLLRAESAALSAAEREEIVEQVVEELAGLGPIEPLVRDPTVTDILVTGVHDVYVERGGKLARVDASFRDDAHLLAVIDRIVSRAGRHVGETSPIVDARLPDGSRVNAVIPPLALDGPVLAIRRFGADLDIETLTANGTLTRRMATLLAACVHARLNILVAGGTGSGKTTLLNALSAFIPGAERVVTIEDAPELRLGRDHVVRLETRPPNIDGRGEVDARDLVRTALRMRASRVILGDLRGAEAGDLLQAMNAGFEGSLATIHASSARDALARLENMVLRSGSALPLRGLREQIAATIDVVVQVARLSDGRRRVVSIAEVAGTEGDNVRTNEIFAFHRSGILGGRVLGRFSATGARPRFAERLRVAGVTLPPGLFDASQPDADDAAPASPNGNGAPATSHAAVTSPRDVGGVDERHTRHIKRLEATIRTLETSLEQEKLEGGRARASAEELRAQLVASRLELDVMQDEVRAARYDADEQRELQSMLQHRSRSLAMAVLNFVDVLGDLLEVGRDSADEAVRDRAGRLRDAASRLLALFGLTEISGIGAPVDDKQHDVVHRVPSDAHASGVVVAVIQRGFAYHGQPVRRAQVLAAE